MSAKETNKVVRLNLSAEELSSLTPEKCGAFMRDKTLQAIADATKAAEEAGVLSADTQVAYKGAAPSYVTDVHIQLSADVPAELTREDLDVCPGVNCFMLHNLLTPEECKEWISELSGNTYKPLDKEFPPEYRSNERIIVFSKSIADAMYHRIESRMITEDVMGVRPMGFGNAGTWRPIGVNECLKFGRYGPGGKFTPHIDGPWVPTEDVSSVYTIVLYLNDDFEGGRTLFLKDQHINSVQESLDLSAEAKTSNGVVAAAAPREVIQTVRPRAGSALIFNHDALHEAEPLTAGHKFIVRTEIMFRRTDSHMLTEEARRGYLKDESYLKMVELHFQAHVKELQGDVRGYTDKYLEAVVLQKKAQASVPQMLDIRIFNNKSTVPLVLIREVFRFLTPQHTATLLCVSKQWYDVLLDGGIWRTFFSQCWPLAVGAERFYLRKARPQPQQPQGGDSKVEAADEKSSPAEWTESVVPTGLSYVRLLPNDVSSPLLQRAHLFKKNQVYVLGDMDSRTMSLLLVMAEALNLFRETVWAYQSACRGWDFGTKDVKRDMSKMLKKMQEEFADRWKGSYAAYVPALFNHFFSFRRPVPMPAKGQYINRGDYFVIHETKAVDFATSPLLRSLLQLVPAQANVHDMLQQRLGQLRLDLAKGKERNRWAMQTNKKTPLDNPLHTLERRVTRSLEGDRLLADAHLLAKTLGPQAVAQLTERLKGCRETWLAMFDHIPATANALVNECNPSLKDWYGAFKNRYVMDVQLPSNALVLDMGHTNFRFGVPLNKQNASMVRHHMVQRRDFTQSLHSTGEFVWTEIKSIVAKEPYTYQAHFRVEHSFRYPVGVAAESVMARDKTGRVQLFPAIEDGGLSHLAFHLIKAGEQHLLGWSATAPILVAEPAHEWSTERRMLMLDYFFENFSDGMPALCFVNSALLAALHHGVEAGAVVVSSGACHCSVTSIWNGNVVRGVKGARTDDLQAKHGQFVALDRLASHVWEAVRTCAEAGMVINNVVLSGGRWSSAEERGRFEEILQQVGESSPSYAALAVSRLRLHYEKQTKKTLRPDEEQELQQAVEDAVKKKKHYTFDLPANLAKQVTENLLPVPPPATLDVVSGGIIYASTTAFRENCIFRREWYSTRLGYY